MGTRDGGHRRRLGSLTWGVGLVVSATLLGCGDASTGPESSPPPELPPQPPPPCVITSFLFEPPFSTVHTGRSTQPPLTITHQNCDSVVVTFSTEDSTIASVSQDGVVTGVWPGVVYIMAHVGEFETSCLVTVRPWHPSGPLKFSHLPVDPAQVSGFLGLGNLNVLPEDHGGFLFPPGDWGKPLIIPVYALADGWIDAITSDDRSFGRDLSMHIRYSTTIVTNYGHMPDLSPEIWAAAGDLPWGATKVDIPVRAGQVVGYAWPGGALDFYIGDDDLQLGFLNPGRYPYPWLKTGYYFDYFKEPQRSQLLAITIRQDEPRGGRVDFDVAGKIIGNWFVEGTTEWDDTAQLAIVYDFVDGTKIAISDGSMVSHNPRVDAEVYWIEGNAPRPEDVGPGYGLVKYEIRQRWFKNTTYRQHVTGDIIGTFLVEMTAPGSIRVEKVLGKRAHEVAGFSGAARVYVR